MDDFFHNQGINTEKDLQKAPLKKPSLKQISILFSIVVLIFAVIGSSMQKDEFYSGILVTEYVLILLPPLILLFLYRFDVKGVLRLNRISFLNGFIILCIMIFALPAVGILNALNLALIKTVFGRVIVEQPPMLPGALGLLINILIIGVTPGICEETLFRGVIMRGLERFGYVKAILITALLFGLLHFDFQKLLGTFLLGALIGFIVYRTNSLYAGILAHFANNSLAVLISVGSSKLMELLKSSDVKSQPVEQNVDSFFSALSSMPKAQLIAAIIVWVFMLVFLLGILAALMFAFIKNTSVKAEPAAVEEMNTVITPALWLLPGVALIAFVYFAEGINLAGIRIEAVDTVLRFIGLK